MNDAAFNLCLENPSLINRKGELVKLDRAKLDSDGYNYAKKKSRSAVFGTAKEESSTGGEKRKKLSEDIRRKNISELNEDIETVDKLMSLLNSERAKLVNTQKYSQAAQVLEQISEKRKEKRKLTDELSILESKETRSKAYHHARKAKAESSSQSEKKSKQKNVSSFFVQHTNHATNVSVTEVNSSNPSEIEALEQFSNQVTDVTAEERSISNQIEASESLTNQDNEVGTSNRNEVSEFLLPDTDENNSCPLSTSASSENSMLFNNEDNFDTVHFLANQALE